MADAQYLEFDLGTARVKVPVNIPTLYARVSYLDGVANLSPNGIDIGEILTPFLVFCDEKAIGKMYLSNSVQANKKLRIMISNTFKVGY